MSAWSRNWCRANQLKLVKDATGHSQHKVKAWSRSTLKLWTYSLRRIIRCQEQDDYPNPRSSVFLLRVFGIHFSFFAVILMVSNLKNLAFYRCPHFLFQRTQGAEKFKKCFRDCRFQGYLKICFWGTRLFSFKNCQTVFLGPHVDAGGSQNLFPTSRGAWQKIFKKFLWGSGPCGYWEICFGGPQSGF